MLVGFLVLLAFDLVGEVTRSLLHLPIPGPVVGMLLLAAALGIHGRIRGTGLSDPPAIDAAAGLLLRHMGLLFVPSRCGHHRRGRPSARRMAPHSGRGFGVERS